MLKLGQITRLLGDGRCASAMRLKSVVCCHLMKFSHGDIVVCVAEFYNEKYWCDKHAKSVGKREVFILLENCDFTQLGGWVRTDRGNILLNNDSLVVSVL